MGLYLDLLDNRRPGELESALPQCDQSDISDQRFRTEAVPSLLSLMSRPVPRLLRPAEHGLRPDARATVERWIAGLAQLRSDQPPTGMPILRWCQFLDDARIFLDRWAALAAELGWTAKDLFGVHPIAPDARHAEKGLLLLAGGEEIIDITAERAVISHRATGSKLVYIRRPRAEAVTVWEVAPMAMNRGN